MDKSASKSCQRWLEGVTIRLNVGCKLFVSNSQDCSWLWICSKGAFRDSKCHLPNRGSLGQKKTAMRRCTLSNLPASSNLHPRTPTSAFVSVSQSYPLQKGAPQHKEEVRSSGLRQKKIKFVMGILSYFN